MIKPKIKTVYANCDTSTHTTYIRMLGQLYNPFKLIRLSVPARLFSNSHCTIQFDHEIINARGVDDLFEGVLNKQI